MKTFGGLFGSALVLSLAACYGDTGDTGPAGTGAKGDTGAAGAAGAAGPKGEPGAKGDNGANGEAGAPNVIKTLSLEGLQSLVFPAEGFLFPDACKTSAYVAGANEHAVVTVAGSMILATSGASGGGGVAVAVATNGDPFAKPTFETQDSWKDDAASGTATKDIVLEAGKSYVFGLAFFSSAAANIVRATCQGTVLIVRE